MTMRLRLLQLAARRPLLALTAAVAIPIALGATIFGATRHDAKSANNDVTIEEGTLDSNPRAVLGRVWFDKYPEKARDELQIWIWFGGGIGIHESGTFYRYAMEIFEFERQADKLSMTYLQDNKKVETKFKVTKCDEKEFDLCLDLTTSLGGHKRYYGFGNVDDMNARVPWAQNVLRSAEALTTR